MRILNVFSPLFFFIFFFFPSLCSTLGQVNKFQTSSSDFNLENSLKYITAKSDQLKAVRNEDKQEEGRQNSTARRHCEREVKMRANISSPGVCCNQQTNGLYSWYVFILQQGAASKSLPMSVWKYSTSLPLFDALK